MWEGGARVPCIMRWPDKIRSGQITSNISSTMDIFPTIAQIIGKKINNKIDGISLLPLLEGISGASPRDEIFYYYGEILIAIRKNN